MSCDPALTSRLELAVAIAREAGAVTLRYFRNDALAVETKSDDSPVTVADREAERLLRGRIAAAFPADGILGEEFGEEPGTSGFRWILDPIDGTKSFIHGVPLYGTLIGVEREGQSLLGVIHIPALDEMAYAAVGAGAWYVVGGQAPRPARVSSVGALAGATFLTSEVGNFEAIGRREAYDRLQSACRLTRTWGDCYGYLLVATGRAELMVDPLMHVWDAAALSPILLEAGGRYSDWSGAASIHTGNGIGSNGHVHDAVLAITRPH